MPVSISGYLINPATSRVFTRLDCQHLCFLRLCKNYKSEQHLHLPILQNSESSTCAAPRDPGPPAPAILSIQAAQTWRLPLPLVDFCALSTTGK